MFLFHIVLSRFRRFRVSCTVHFVYFVNFAILQYLLVGSFWLIYNTLVPKVKSDLSQHIRDCGTNLRQYVKKYTQYLLLLICYWHSHYMSSVTHMTKPDSTFELQSTTDLANSCLKIRKQFN